MSQLILVRHAKSDWNAKGLWTGLTDVPLCDEGREEARETAAQLRDLTIHRAHVSKLKRAKETLDIILEHLELDIPVHEHEAINERDYGIFTGKNKWQVKDEMGEERFQRIRRSWAEPIPEGETLADVHARVAPHFREKMLPQLLSGESVLVVAHGNSLRALVKELEGIADDDIAGVEIGVGEAHLYELDSNGRMRSKEVRAENKEKGKI